MSTSRREVIRQLGVVLAGAGLSSWRMPHLATVSANEPIRLSSNENPHGPSAKAVKEMTDAASISNRYQWQMIRDLMQAIATHHGVDNEQVLVGAGSTQVIDNVVRYAALRAGSFVIATPTFSRWAPSAEKCGLIKIEVPLTRLKTHNLDAMLSAIRKDTRLVYICNPNNPTGTICRRDALEKFVRNIPPHCIVLVDEAYLDYTHERSLCDLTKELQNLVIVRTFSKIYGMAGARIGYAVAHTDTITRIADLDSGANAGISAASLAGALASLKDDSFVQHSFAANEAARSFTTEQLERLGIHCIPSHSNFVYFSLESFPGDFFSLLKARNIEGTHLFEERGKWSRITVGTMTEMKAFISAIS